MSDRTIHRCLHGFRNQTRSRHRRQARLRPVPPTNQTGSQFRPVRCARPYRGPIRSTDLLGYSRKSNHKALPNAVSHVQTLPQPNRSRARLNHCMTRLRPPHPRQPRQCRWPIRGLAKCVLPPSPIRQSHIQYRRRFYR